jgi:hypothetical protein
MRFLQVAAVALLPKLGNLVLRIFPAGVDNGIPQAVLQGNEYHLYGRQLVCTIRTDVGVFAFTIYSVQMPDAA